MFARAALTRYSALGGLNKKRETRLKLLTQFYRLEFQYQVVCRLVPSENSEGESVPCPFLASAGWLAIFALLWLADTYPICACMFRGHVARRYVCLCVQISPSYKDAGVLDEATLQ